MWHDQGLDPATIAQLLRDPPLKMATVTGYILSAIQVEKLPVNKERLHEEITSSMPEATLRMRFPVVATMVAGLG